MRSRVASAVALLVALAASACASAPPETPPDRDLFRLGPVQILPAVETSVTDDDATGLLVGAWQTELRFLRPDGTTIAAPRLVVLPGRRGTIQVVERTSYVQNYEVSNEMGAWIADPVIGTVASGVSVEVAVFDVEESDTACGEFRAEAALAWRITASDLRRPLDSRAIGVLCAAADLEVSLQFPRCANAESSGALRLAVGEESEIARFPDPTGEGEFVVCARIERVSVHGPAAHAEPPAADDAGLLLALGRSAAAGDRTGRICVTAVRLPEGVADADARDVERLSRLSLSSVLAVGVRAADLLREAYLSDWDFGVNTPPCEFDPIVGTHESGLSAEVAQPTGGGGILVLRWRVTPRWERVHYTPVSCTRAHLLELPASLAVERRVPLEPGRSVHPVFRLPDGGTAALVVEFEPGR